MPTELHVYYPGVPHGCELLAAQPGVDRRMVASRMSFLHALRGTR